LTRAHAQITEHINVDELGADEDEDVVGGALAGAPGSRRSRGISHAESIATLRTPMHTGPSTGILFHAHLYMFLSVYSNVFLDIHRAILSNAPRPFLSRTIVLRGY
jgi:hypothetical protein